MKRERQRADAVLRGEVDRLAPARRHPHRRVRLLHRLGHDVARRHRDVVAGVAGERRLGEAAERDAQPLLPHRPLLQRVDLEAAQLRFRRRLARAEVGAAVRHEVEHRDALGDARGMVERRRRLHDAVTEPDALRALRHRAEEHLGRARVAVLLEEVVLHLPHVVDAELVRELALLERVLDQRDFGVVTPRPRQLVLVEDPDFHDPDGTPSEPGVSRPAMCWFDDAGSLVGVTREAGVGRSLCRGWRAASTPSQPCSAVAYIERKSTVCTRFGARRAR